MPLRKGEKLVGISLILVHYPQEVVIQNATLTRDKAIEKELKSRNMQLPMFGVHKLKIVCFSNEDENMFTITVTSEDFKS
jgi:hypothetical protein